MVDLRLNGNDMIRTKWLRLGPLHVYYYGYHYQVITV